MAYWLVQASHQHDKRSRVADDMLTRYTNISADKQRLKVWYAQLLLTGEAPAAARDLLLVRLDGNIQALRSLIVLQARQLAEEGLPTTLDSDSDTLDVLQQNFSSFRQRVNQTQADRKSDDTKQIWTEMLGIFDMAGSRDVRIMIAAAINQQSRIVQQAAAASDTTFLRSNIVLAIRIVLTFSVTLAMAWYFARQLKQPIEDLLLGTQRMQASQLDQTRPVTVPERSQDEFGQLAHSFNAMALEIHSTRLQEKARNQQLEAAVQERTAQLTSANAELQNADKRRRQLFADLSHELRTPATAILGEAEIALRGKDKPASDYRLSLGNIASTTRQLAQRINELLLLAHEQSLAAEVKLDAVLLLPVLEEAVVQARSIADGSGVVIEELAGDLVNPSFSALTNAAGLHQILMVLYDNAVRYTPDGGRVQTCVDASGTGVEVVITDTGIGLQAQEASEVFKRNFRGVHARRMRSDGAGLGLAIAKTLADALGVAISLCSQPGGGCRAVLLIPGKDQYARTGD